MKSLNTERLLLRKWEEADLKDLYEYAKCEDVGPNAGWLPHKNEDESKKILNMFINSNDTYAIVLKSENKVIGSISMHDKSPDESRSNLKEKQVGFVLNPKYWGNGYIPEAVNYIINYLFNELKTDIIWCGHYDFNHKSKRVVEKCGFKYRFMKTERLKLLNNVEVSVLYYNILKTK